MSAAAPPTEDAQATQSRAFRNNQPFVLPCTEQDYEYLVFRMKRSKDGVVSTVKNGGGDTPSVTKKGALRFHAQDLMGWLAEQKITSDKAQAAEIGEHLLDTRGILLERSRMDQLRGAPMPIFQFSSNVIYTFSQPQEMNGDVVLNAHRKFGVDSDTSTPSSPSSSSGSGEAKDADAAFAAAAAASSAAAISSARSATEVGAVLRKSILRMYGAYLSDDGRTIDYVGLRDSEAFFAYRDAVLELQDVDLTPLTDAERKCFFINIYNSLMVHASIEIGIPTKPLQRKFFFTHSAYVVGGLVYTLDDIEHGILRANARHPSPLKISRQLPKRDKRRQFALPPPIDPRVHFALVCGAKSCPPIQLYTPDNVDDALTLAAASFLSSEATVDHASQTVTLSKIFHWYKSDFGSSDVDVLAWCAAHASAGTPLADDLKRAHTGPKVYTVRHSEYNWASMAQTEKGKKKGK